MLRKYKKNYLKIEKHFKFFSKTRIHIEKRKSSEKLGKMIYCEADILQGKNNSIFLCRK